MRAAEEYTKRLENRVERVASLDGRQRRLEAIRLGIAAVVAVLAWESLHAHAISLLWLLPPVAAFIGVVAYHSRVRGERARAERAAAFYRRGLERLDDRSAAGGQAGEAFNLPHHVYAADLDLFGNGGLFALLCTARTRMGEETLARWLSGPASLDEIRGRHEALRDLRDRLDLREDVAVLPGSAHGAVEPSALLAWAESPNVLERAWIRWAARLLPGLCVCSAVVWAVLGIGEPFVAVVLAEIAVLYRLRPSLDGVLDAAARAFDDLKAVAGLLERIEREPFAASALGTLARGLAGQGGTAARSITRLSTIAQLAESRENQFVKILSVPSLYSIHVALAAERWRGAHGRGVRGWFEAAGRFEALSSLAQYSFEHPRDPLPQLIDDDSPRFEAEGLGHPLIPPGQCVRNDLAIGGRTRALLVSGSNMSGKSTLLRAVGLNTVLAMAGAPVRARSLRLTPLQVGATIRIDDSLAEGSSRFYAEITRLRELLDLASGERPLLFLLDEILQGTNSRDRRIGAEAIVRAFVRRKAIGLVSTHDLALTEIGGVEDGTLRNVHFEDAVVNGRMVFDFVLRDGVVEKSNGLDLMRSIGLEV